MLNLRLTSKRSGSAELGEKGKIAKLGVCQCNKVACSSLHRSRRRSASSMGRLVLKREGLADGCCRVHGRGLLFGVNLELCCNQFSLFFSFSTCG